MNSNGMNRRSFLASVAASAGAMALSVSAEAQFQDPPPGVETSEKHPENHAVVQAGDDSRLKILQLTDSHFFQRGDGLPRDARTLDDWRRMIDRFQPNLLAMTGDLWHDNPDGEGDARAREVIAWIDALGVPWLFTWGNHDRVNDVPAAHDAFHEAKHSLYRGGPNGGNYTVCIQNGAGEAVWNLLCLNTHYYGAIGHTYDWLGEYPEQTAPGFAAPAFAFLHIPLKQYADVKERGAVGGFMFEKTSHEREDGLAFDRMKQMGNVRACFCGHDHKNDCSGLMDGIELVYGRASGWSGYGWREVRKGGKLITIDTSTRAYAWETVFADGLRWRPEPDVEIEELLDDPWMKDPVPPDEAYPVETNA